MVAYETMHYLKRKNHGREGYATLKIDMSKTYDRSDWDFLKNKMIKMGFSMKWVDLIMLCVSIVRYFVVHNGHELGPIVPGRGLRQGDLLSPYLFILCVEGLSAYYST